MRHTIYLACLHVANALQKVADFLCDEPTPVPDERPRIGDPIVRRPIVTLRERVADLRKELDSYEPGRAPGPPADLVWELAAAESELERAENGVRGAGK